MSANKENNLVQAYVELNKFCQSGDYDRALKSAGKILQVAPGEQKAFHCKVICFVQLHNFKEALAVLCNPKNAALSSGLHFEKAYAQYRLNCPKDALATVDAAPELTPALKELRAQILYRLEEYQDCYTLYRDLLKNTSDEYEDERKANMAAVVANLAAVNPSSDLPQFDESTYELTYNAGSTLAMRGKYNEALPVLKRAEQACAESVREDGGTEEEAKEEAGIIRVQQAYCLQQMGKEKEAAGIYQNVLKDKPSDQALVAIASNNLVVINRDTNVFDSRKRMKAASADGLEHKLNSRQRASITYNQAILAIYSNQPELCKQCCVRLQRDLKQPQRATLVEASSLAKEGKRAQAQASLLRHGGPLVLAAAQLALAQGDRKAAIKILEESEYKYKPAVVSTLCTLLCADNELERASDMFKDVYEHYKNDERQVNALRMVWRAAAEIHARAGRAAAAAAAHEALARAAPDDSKTLAKLVKALAAADPQRAKQLATRLPPIEELESKIDIEALESSKWMMGAKIVKKTVSKQEQSPGTPGSELLQKKSQKPRKRKSKLPPNADLARPPDPERWLPKYERTAYRKRRGVRRDVIKGSQGMTTTATDQYDMSKQVPTASVAAAAAKSPRVEKEKESGWQRKQQQKKKGKRR